MSKLIDYRDYLEGSIDIMVSLDSAVDSAALRAAFEEPMIDWQHKRCHSSGISECMREWAVDQQRASTSMKWSDRQQTEDWLDEESNVMLTQIA
jgi:hypothetical protein